ncbi:glycogen synthase GlgA [Marinomonas mediterranea]|uniref:glycogen synthase GlgA n=1 Tax=Marinomonas mediterranea TaxID=119864 RepID=UPI00234B431E|nr:glycogen synthase GlgA [Marinomonas mediterranea]WCN12479.1 glycogen synthase GlgA [Marinomonas mediterranea]
MKILFAASEIYPLIKTGGLADVAGSLPVALRKQGHDARMIMPAYNSILDKVAPIHNSTNLGNPFGIGDIILLESCIQDSDTPIYLVQCQSMYEREHGPYLDANGNDFEDNHLRFGILSWVSAMLSQYGTLMGWQPDILHLNDWQTGFAAAYLASWKTDHIPIVTTVHNLRYNGSFNMSKWATMRLSSDLLSLHGMEFYGNFSGLKAGLVFADAVTTVSPTYAAEILTPEYGDGLDGTLRSMKDRLHGILNGVDYDQWSPAKDTYIAKNYGINSIEDKLENKLALLRECGLPEDPSKPIFGIVSRLTEQKGLDLVLDAIPSVLDRGGVLIVLGSGDKALEQAYVDLSAQYPNQVHVRIGYDEAYSHRVQAGSDVFLIPSRFEPCGLTQLYALKYGTLPLVRKTGGLADTVFEEGDSANGFVFNDATAQSLQACLDRCMSVFSDLNHWRRLQHSAMSYDFSWEQTTDKWEALYHSLLR